jgi:hypothetical protein
LNQAIFTELFLDEIDGGLIEIVHQAYTPEIRDLVGAPADWRTGTTSRSSGAEAQNDTGPVRGTDEPGERTLAALLRVPLSGVGVGPPWWS